jgi:hypothetical protein
MSHPKFWESLASERLNIGFNLYEVHFKIRDDSCFVSYWLRSLNF